MKNTPNSLTRRKVIYWKAIFIKQTLAYLKLFLVSYVKHIHKKVVGAKYVKLLRWNTLIHETDSQRYPFTPLNISLFVI